MEEKRPDEMEVATKAATKRETKTKTTSGEVQIMSLEMHEAIIGAPQGQGDSSPTYRQSIYQESPVNKLYENRLEMPTAQNLGYERTTPLKETPRPKTTPWSYSLN